MHTEDPRQHEARLAMVAGEKEFIRFDRWLSEMRSAVQELQFKVHGIMATVRWNNAQDK